MVPGMWETEDEAKEYYHPIWQVRKLSLREGAQCSRVPLLLHVAFVGFICAPSFPLPP